MGVYTDKFLNNYSASGGRYVYRPSFDVGAELSNFSSVALTEASNYMTLMESTFDPQEQRILEAKLDVLYEVSIKDIGAKIKSFFKWIKDQVKKFFAWVKGLFKKTKSAETKSNAKKADDAAKKIPPAQSPTQGAEEAKNQAIQAAGEAIRKGEEPKKAVIDQLNDNPDLAHNKKALAFVKQITSLNILYLDIKDIINFNFQAATNAKLAQMRKIGNIASANASGDYGRTSTVGEIEAVGRGKEECFCLTKKFITMMNNKGTGPITKNSEAGSTGINFNPKVFDEVTEEFCYQRMVEALKSMNLDDLSTYTKWLDNKANTTANVDIKTIERLITTLEKQISDSEKTTEDMLKMKPNSSSHNGEAGQKYLTMLPAVFGIISSILRFNHSVCKKLGSKLQYQLTALNNVSKTILGIATGNTMGTMAEEEKF